jgi:molecular chaperone GrpE
MKKLLPVLDIFEQALKPENCQEIEQLREGIEQVERLLLKTLKDEGLEELAALEKEMNPEHHEVLLTETTEDKERHNQVVEVFRTGYSLKDRVLRAAQVKVAKKS